MIWLARLLIREKWRKLLVQYGWAGCASLGVMLTAIASAGAVAAARLLSNAAQVQVSAALSHLWLAWIMMGLFIGKDLTWQIRLERLKVFPVPGFMRLYLISFLLSFASFPLFLGLILFEIAGSMRRGLSFAALIQILLAYGLFVASVRSAVSLARTVIHRSSALSGALKLFSFFVILILTGWIVASIVDPGFETLLPGDQLGRALTGMDPFRSVSFLAGLVLLLSIADFVVQRSVTYSGLTGPPARGNHMISRGLLLVHAPWPTPLWRISLLGWLRNRNALLLLMWGGLYGFFWMYLSKPEGALEFLLFCWMVQIFHSYLRGNLLGVDQAGVWLYYMFPAPVQKSLRAKNQTLSVLQGCMVAAVLLPGLLRPVPGMGAADWLLIISYAYSSILLAEIIGSFFSLRYPEPIDRSSQFSGGMTVGALIVPLFQILFAALFLLLTGLTRRFLSPAALWLELIAMPAPLWFVRSALMPGWIQKTMVNKRKAILAKLSVFSS